MFESIIIIAAILAGLILFIWMAERFIDVHNQEAIRIDKLHPASYRKVENRFKAIKEDFLHKKYLYEKKEKMNPYLMRKKNRRPHISQKFKEDEWKE
jgi:hypothetical protein